MIPFARLPIVPKKRGAGLFYHTRPLSFDFQQPQDRPGALDIFSTGLNLFGTVNKNNNLLGDWDWDKVVNQKTTDYGFGSEPKEISDYYEYSGIWQPQTQEESLSRFYDSGIGLLGW